MLKSSSVRLHSCHFGLSGRLKLGCNFRKSGKCTSREKNLKLWGTTIKRIIANFLLSVKILGIIFSKSSLTPGAKRLYTLKVGTSPHPTRLRRSPIPGLMIGHVKWPLLDLELPQPKPIIGRGLGYFKPLFLLIFFHQGYRTESYPALVLSTN